MRSNPAESSNGPAPGPPRIAVVGAGILTAFGFCLLFLLMLSMGLRRGMNHDESLPVAAGAVFARHLLLPYRDYPYFHMPDLVLLYGILFRWCRFVLLPARLFSVVAGWLTVLLLWIMVRWECRGKSLPVRWLLPAAAALLLFSSPVFRDAFWRTWNHALATLFGLAAVAFALRAGLAQKPDRGWRWFWAGFFIGLAIGTRLTFAPLFAPLAVAAALEPAGGSPRQRIRRVATFSAGAAVSLLPSLILFAMAPSQFLYGNFTFNSTTNILLRQAEHHPGATLRDRLLFPFIALLPDRSNLLLALLFLLLVAAALARFSKLPAAAKYRLLLVLALFPFAFIGAIAPQVTQNEYYYPFVPLLVLAVAISAAGMRSIFTLLTFAAAILTTAWTWHDYQWLSILKRPGEWPPVLFHEAGLEVRQSVAGGRVLTLEPIIPLEAGLDIYPALVTGGIAWRAEPFVAPADRDRLDMMGPDNFSAKMEQTHPAAIITTSRNDQEGMEEPMTAWARDHHWTPHPLQPRGKFVDPATVWTPP